MGDSEDGKRTSAQSNCGGIIWGNIAIWAHDKTRIPIFKTNPWFIFFFPLG